MWKAIESVGPILDMGRFQIEGALLEEEEMIRNSYENRIQVIRNAMAATTLDVSVANEMIRFLLQQMGVEMSKFGKDTQATFFGMTQSTKQWGQMAAGVTTQIGDAMAAMVADSKRGWVGLVMVILRAIQKIILMRLAEAYAGMIAKETGSKGLIGLATAAVGIAAITGLFQTWVNSSMTGLATGGTVTSAGNFIIGEKGPEILNLPIGAAVTPMSQSQAASPGGGTLTAIVSGRDLEFVLNQWDIDKNRMF